jgi:hypothetical protein
MEAYVLLKTPVTRLNEDRLDEMIALVEAWGLPYNVDATITARDDGALMKPMLRS